MLDNGQEISGGLKWPLLIPGSWGTNVIKLLDDPMDFYSLANYPLKQLWSFDHFEAGFFATQFHHSSSIITHHFKSSYA
jgi:hypothetical protein